MVFLLRATKPQCSKCGAKFVYTLKDGTVVCRTCGARKQPRPAGKEKR